MEFITYFNVYQLDALQIKWFQFPCPDYHMAERIVRKTCPIKGWCMQCSLLEMIYYDTVKGDK